LIFFLFIVVLSEHLKDTVDLRVDVEERTHDDVDIVAVDGVTGHTAVWLRALRRRKMSDLD
jgi:hypothetical protein